MLHGQDIVCFSSIDWDSIWHGHQEIMSSLAAAGNRVLFVENTGVRAPTFQDWPRLQHRFANWRRSTKGFRQERENLFVYSPLILPFPYSRVARWINRALLLRALESWMRAAGCKRPIVWTFLPTRLVVDLIDRLDHELVVYYCVADFQQLSPSKDIAHSERALLDRADLVFVQNEGLRQHCAPHPHMHVVPCGVNMQTFGRSVEPAPELGSLTPPIVGYLGGLHRHADVELIRRVALQVDATVVLVGPILTDVERLRGLRNVVFIGPQPYARVPEFLRAFNVGIIPYQMTDYTKTVYPTKLNEYLAMGIPVVTTDLPEIRRFNVERGGVVAVAEDADAFVEAVREAVQDGSSSSEVTRRIEAAKRNSWKEQIAQMSGLMEEALRVRQASTEQRWRESLLRLYRTGRRRLTKLALALGLGYLAIFQSPLVWVLAEPLRLAAPARPADAIVVLAGGVGESGTAGGGYQERVKQAVELYGRGLAPKLVFSSGYTFVFQEAEMMKELATTLGVPASAIILEKQAANTAEQARSVVQVLREQRGQTVLLVSSPYHMRRAVSTFRKAAPWMQVIPSPVPSSQFYAHDRGASVEQLQGILHEYLGILYYWWKGWM